MKENTRRTYTKNTHEGKHTRRNNREEPKPLCALTVLHIFYIHPIAGTQDLGRRRTSTSTRPYRARHRSELRIPPGKWDPSAQSGDNKSEQVRQCMDLQHCLHTGYTWSPLT
jgi:hypothetical protein